MELVDDVAAARFARLTRSRPARRANLPIRPLTNRRLALAACGSGSALLVSGQLSCGHIGLLTRSRCAGLYDTSSDASGPASPRSYTAAATRVADRLTDTTNVLARSLRRDRHILSLTLERIWGAAFEAYDAVAYASYEQGAYWASDQHTPDRPLVWSTLLDPHARACSRGG
jgi:hypothetical protein